MVRRFEQVSEWKLFSQIIKGHNSFKKTQIILVIKLVPVIMVMNLPMKFRINSLRNTRVI